MAIAQNFPNIRPSLNLDFANVKALDPRITFARASAATYYGTDTAKAEENLLEQSQALATNPWAQLRATRTNNAATAPDGTTTATAITQATGETTAGQAQRTNFFVVPDAYTFSVFVKPNGKNFFRFLEALSDGTNRQTWFDIQNGTVGTTFAGHTASISAAPEGFFRCVITFTVNAARAANFTVGVADTDGSTTVVDSGGIFAWGCQLEQRDAVTAYTPTTTQPITNFVPVLESAAAGEARFDHNPVTGESLGLLIEESRSNLLTRSEEFDNAGWGKLNSTITANTIVAPDGTLTGGKLVEAVTANQAHRLSQNVTITGGATVTLSAYIKGAGRNITLAGVDNVANSGFGAIFDPVNGQLVGAGFGFNGGTFTSSSITFVGNGWYRASVTGVVSASGTSFQYRFELRSGTTLAYNGDGSSGIFIWGASLEQGAFPTSYLKTTTAQVTRAADAASMTGANFSSFYNMPVGTTYVEAVPVHASGSMLNERGIVSYSLGVFGTGHVIRQFGSFSTALSRFGGGSIAATSATLVTAGQSFKAAAVFSTTERAISFNGGAVSVNSTVLPDFTPTQMIIGDQEIASSSPRNWNGTIKKIAYYPARVTNDQLQALTG